MCHEPVEAFQAQQILARLEQSPAGRGVCRRKKKTPASAGA